MKYFCPICDDTLLCHLQQREIIWFCLRCHQEMPNFNLIEGGMGAKNSLQPIEFPNCPETFPIKRETNKQVKIINKQLNLLDSVINSGKKRLEVVSFILSQINYIVRQTLTDTERDATPKKSHLNAPEGKRVNPHKFSQTDFIRDSEIIVLYICQAILTHDISVLNNQRLPELKATYAKLNIPVEQIVYLIHLIKTSVLDFLHSTALDSELSESSQSYCLDTEVSNYFDVVIDSII